MKHFVAYTINSNDSWGHCSYILWFKLLQLLIRVILDRQMTLSLRNYTIVITSIKIQEATIKITLRRKGKKKNIFWLDITMKDAPRVRCCNCFSNLWHQANGCWVEGVGLSELRR